MADKEYRHIDINPSKFLKIEKTSHVEKRADGTEETVEENKMVLEGYPIVFNEETLIGDERSGWKEIIDAHALDNADMSDTPLKYNHQDITPILARVRNGSLKLTIDEVGLHMRAELIDTQQNRDFYKMVQAGLLDKMSFAFNVVEEQMNNQVVPAMRRVMKIGRLFDVSIVDVPAYDQTSLIARSKAIAEARAKAEAEAEARALEEAEASNRLKLEQERREAEAKAFEFRKKKEFVLLQLGVTEKRALSKKDVDAMSTSDKKKLANDYNSKLDKLDSKAAKLIYEAQDLEYEFAKKLKKMSADERKDAEKELIAKLKKLNAQVKSLGDDATAIYKEAKKLGLDKYGLDDMYYDPYGWAIQGSSYI